MWVTSWKSVGISITKINSFDISVASGVKHSKEGKMNISFLSHKKNLLSHTEKVVKTYLVYK